jgi:hypothetical protein
MVEGNSVQRWVCSFMTCSASARNASILGNPGRTMQKLCSRSREGLETTRSRMRAPGQRSSRHTKPGGRTITASIITPIVSARTGDTALPRCCVGCWGAPTRDLMLSRALYATQFTRHLDKHGYIRFKHWRFFGENGLSLVQTFPCGSTRIPSRLNIRQRPFPCMRFASHPISSRSTR